MNFCPASECEMFKQWWQEFSGFHRGGGHVPLWACSPVIPKEGIAFDRIDFDQTATGRN